MNLKLWFRIGLLLVIFCNNAEAKFLAFGEKVGPGTEIKDFNRRISLQTTNSLWNISVSAKMISITHSQDFDVYINLQESVYRAEFVDRVFASRKADLKEFMPQAHFWVEQESLQVAGVNALMMRYEDLTKDRMYQEIFFVINKTAYQLSFVAKPETFFQHELDFEDLFNSLKNLGGPVKQGKASSLVEDNPYNPANSAGF